MAHKTQGTELYVIDPADGSVINVGCVTTITGLDSTIEQIETTCLASAAREYVGGLATPGTGSFTINTDDEDISHVRLFELKQSAATLRWAIGWRQEDATGAIITPGTPPTVITDSNGDYEFDLPPQRGWLLFDGFMNAFPFDFSQNAVVTSQVGIQISGDPMWIQRSAS